LYVSALDGVPKLLFPQIREAFDQFLVHEDWQLIETARKNGYERARSRALHLIELFKQTEQKGPEKVRKEIESTLISPLYCDKPKEK